MSGKWYYAKGDRQLGPVTVGRLKELARAGALAPADHVWREGMAGWVPARQVRGLFEDACPPARSRALPPPLPGGGGRPPGTGVAPPPDEPAGEADVLAPARLAAPEAPGTAAGELDPQGAFPWPVEERSALNPSLRWAKVSMIASIVVGTLFLLSIVAAIGCLPFFSLAYLIYEFAIKPGRLHGRWVPSEGPAGWVEFLPGGIFKREDGTVGTFTLLPNQKFIDLRLSGRLADSWRILSWGTQTLEVQDAAGAVRSFTKGKTFEEKRASVWSTDRSHLLQNKWEPVSGDGPAIQFTKDGAMIRFDGFAARYTFSGEEPNEVVTVHLDDRRTIELKVLSLGRDEMVLAGEGGTCHYRRGVSITDAESQRRMDAAKEQLMKVGKAVAVTAGAIGVGIAVLGVAAASAARTTCPRCGFTRSGLSANCPNCGWYS